MPAEVNGCLKSSLVVFNIIIALIGAVRIIFAIINGVDYWSVYLPQVITIGISCLGIYGACREKKCALIWYCLFLSFGIAICLTVAVFLWIELSSMTFYTGIWIIFGTAGIQLIVLIISSVLTHQIRARDRRVRNQRSLSPVLMQEFSHPPEFDIAGVLV